MRPVLCCRLQAHIDSAKADQAEAAEGRPGSAARHLKHICSATELVFGSAAALSAAFGKKVRGTLSGDLQSVTYDIPNI